MRGPWSLGVCKEGIQLSPQTLIVSPFLTLHYVPYRITSFPFKILFQAYEPPYPSIASIIEQFGKNFDLNTL